GDNVISMLLDDIGELEDTKKFKENVLSDAKLSRQEFDSMVDDIKNTVKDGGIAELEALFEAMELERAGECYSEDEDDCSDSCSSCSLHEGCDKITEAFGEMSEPYSIEKRECEKGSENDKCGDEDAEKN
ncbi:hypothetical protein KAU11_04615, partial [Candidatus Babeliales bacterium]|nr:hypothetical protein [Candidatus Babeliales bacterium]